MLELINLVVGCLINVVALLYMCNKFTDKPINYLTKKYIIIVILMTAYWSVSYIITTSIVRIIISFFLLSSACLILFKEKISKSVIISFISLGILLISELIYLAIVVFLCKVDMNQLITNFFGKLFSDFCIILIAIGLTVVIINRTKLKKSIDRISEKTQNSFVYILFISFINIIMLVYCIYFEINLLLGLSFGVIIITVYIVFTINLIKEKSNNFKLLEQNKSMIISLEEYEKMYTFQRMKNHEHNNELSVLRGMIDTNDKKAIKYIDNIIGLKKDITGFWMETLKIIPEGGLRGIIYYKLLETESEKIKLEFTINRKFKSTSYLNLDENIKLNVCKLLGIYLDNAIQANKEIKEKYLSLNIDEDDNYIKFTIGNKFANDIDMEKITDGRYSSKDKGRGHGLLIAKEILEKETNIENFTKVVRNKFVQEIRIKKKKTHHN